MYPEEASIQDKTLMQLYSQHEFTGEAGMVSITAGAVNLASYFSGPESAIYVILILTSEELRLRRIEAELARQDRKQREIERRLSALERLNRSNDHLLYHSLLDAGDRQWWHSQGINDASIDAYQLGVCYNCPTDYQHRPSYTIPIYDSRGETLLNIRHRESYRRGFYKKIGWEERPQAANFVLPLT